MHIFCTKGRDESRWIWCVDISINSLGHMFFCFEKVHYELNGILESNDTSKFNLVAKAVLTVSSLLQHSIGVCNLGSHGGPTRVVYKDCL